MCFPPRRRAVLPLTPRQRQILDYLRSGSHTPSTVSTLLNLTPKTIYIHLHSAYQRLNVSTLEAALSLTAPASATVQPQ